MPDFRLPRHRGAPLIASTLVLLTLLFSPAASDDQELPLPERDPFSPFAPASDLSLARTWEVPSAGAGRDAAWGDVNGDGRLDLVVSYEGGDAELYLNKGGGLATEPAWTSSNAETWGVALGDLDGDGDLDLACADRVNTRVYENVTGSLTTDPVWISATSPSRDVVLGDVDNDGDLDMVVAGEGSRLYRNDGNITFSPVWSQSSSDTEALALGDMDGDGYLDLVCANYLGAPRGALATGRAVAPAGDVNGDGYDDFAVSGYGYSPFVGYKVWVFFGGPSVDATADLVLSGGLRFGYYPNTVGGGGDVNGDGFDDVIVGDYLNDAGGSNAGRAYVYFGGATPDEVPDLILTGTIEGESLGRSVGNAGDVNGDGFDDVIVGASSISANGPGRAYVYYGGPSPDSAADLILTADEAADRFGTSATIAGDMNGDGFDDVVVGAYLAGQSNAGRAYVYYGGANPDSVADLTMTGTLNYGYFGVSVAPAGDVNGDGFDDVIAGAYLAGQTGQVRVYYGGASPDNLADLVLTGEMAFDYFGYSVWTAGDVNGDGFDDVIVGASLNDAIGLSGGRAYLYYGGAAPDSEVDLVVTGQNRYDFFGYAVGTAGDVNGDGYADVIVGAYGNDFSGSAGRAYLYYGAASPDNEADLGIAGADAGIREGGANAVYLNTGDGTFGSVPVWQSDLRQHTDAVALGDVDGDGDLDAVFGSFLGADLSMLKGRHAFYRNDGNMLATSPDWVSDVATANRSVVLGDMDRDGDLDLVTANLNGTNEIFVNDGGGFGAVADIVFGGTSALQGTWSVDLGDVDDDGDLDVCEVNVTSNVLYANETVLGFAEVPMWSSRETDASQAVVVGDVNGDGSLDLAFANDGRNTIYYGTNGAPSDSASWVSGFREDTRGVALADVDGDGNLDLACGNHGANLTLYTGIPLQSVGSPSWYSSAPRSAKAVELADVDRDGDPDLIAGIDLNDEAYENTGGVLGDFPKWFFPLGMDTEDIAVGDVDNDGDLDVVSASRDAPNRLFLNVDGKFQLESVWASPLSSTSTSVSLGDINGDGKLDVAFGNEGQTNTLHLNVGGDGIFTLGPTWVSGSADLTSSIALRDADGDGDVDIVCGNLGPSGPSKQVYFVAGVPSTQPGWISPDTDDTRGIALADVDRDGDLDLVSANYNQPNTVRAGRRNPTYAGDPTAPTNQLPNTASTLRAVTALLEETNHYRVRLTAYDVESDPLWLFPEYRVQPGFEWLPLLFEGLSERIGPLDTSPQGVLHEFSLDVTRFPIDADVDFRFRWTSVPMRVSEIQNTGWYLLELRPLLVSRPVVGASSALSLATVTVGDTVSTELTIANEGNQPLELEDIVLPIPAMRAIGNLPQTIRPGITRTFPIFFEPTVIPPDGLEIHLITDDPLTPDTSIPVATEVLDLVVDVRDQAPGEEAPLGEALTIQVTPVSTGIHVEGGYLFYRPGRPGSVFADSLRLFPVGNSFVATIPASDVTEAGLEYYVRVENSGVERFFPAGAPNTVYTKPVAAPQHFTLAPQENTSGGFLAGANVNVQVFLPTGALFEHGLLHFREGGETTYREASIDTAGLLPRAVIPDSTVGSRGIDFWAEVTTASGDTLTEPSQNPEASPLSFQTTVLNLTEEKTHRGERYRMVSIPLDFGSDLSVGLAALLSDQPSFGPYDSKRWRSFWYSPSDSEYVELTDEGSEDDFAPRPGRAYWLISRNSHTVDTAPVRALSTSTETDYSIALAPGWNQIGNPFAFPVAWARTLVDGTPASEQSDVERPVFWDASRGRWGEYDPAPADVLLPFAGYWVRNRSGGTVELAIPPEEAEVAEEQALSAAIGRKGGWRLDISASVSDVADRAVAGVQPGALNESDVEDWSDPPLAPGGGVSVYFPDGGWSRGAGRYAVDIRSPVPLETAADESAGHVWPLDVVKNLGGETRDEVVLSFDLDRVPDVLWVFLNDRLLDRFADLRGDPEYRFYLGSRNTVAQDAEARFELLVGSAAFIQSQREQASSDAFTNRAFQNYPNPFRANTVIRYEIEKQGPVRITIYDIQGRLVRSLVDDVQDPGRYEVLWEGDDEQGRPQALGIYFYRIQSGGMSTTRRMVMVGPPR